MPRITPLRTVTVFVGSYLSLLVLWLALPSPAPTGSNDGYTFHERTLHSGAVLTTVHESLDVYENRDPSRYSRRRAHAIDWQLRPDCNNNAILLNIGQDAQVDLTELASQATPQRSDIAVSIKGGDVDGVNPPWFTFADAVLLFWDIHHETRTLDVQVLSHVRGEIRIEAGTEILAAITGIPVDQRTCDLTQIKVSDMSKLVPSSTYQIRHYMIKVLAPLTLTIMAIAGSLSTICFAIAYLAGIVVVIYCSTLWICWALSGFPPWREWRQQHLQNRGFRSGQKRSIWGVAGPLPEGMHAEQDEHLQHDYNGPRPVTSIGEFFRSRSPLDDLLATFDSTRWMVQPLRQPLRQQTANHNVDIEKDISASGHPKITINGYN